MPSLRRPQTPFAFIFRTTQIDGRLTRTSWPVIVG
jgi:hypothetical protein